MIVHFNISPGATYGRIEKETPNGLVSLTTDEAKEAWCNVGTISDCNYAFRRLAVDFDFDVEGCLKWYRDNE